MYLWSDWVAEAIFLSDEVVNRFASDDLVDDNTAGSLRNYRPKINMNVEMGEGSNLVISPDPMDLGDRANGAWNP